jgi:hypothetical protein
MLNVYDHSNLSLVSYGHPIDLMVLIQLQKVLQAHDKNRKLGLDHVLYTLA